MPRLVEVLVPPSPIFEGDQYDVPDEHESGEGPKHDEERLHSRQTYSFMSALAKAANATSVTVNSAKLISHGRS